MALEQQDGGETAHFLACKGWRGGVSIHDGTVDLLLVPAVVGLPPTTILQLASTAHGGFNVLLDAPARRCPVDLLRRGTGRSGTGAQPFEVVWQERYGATTGSMSTC